MTVSNEGYLKLKQILADMKEKKYQKIEVAYETLLKLLYEIQYLKYQKNILLDRIEKLKNISESNQLKELDQVTESLIFIKDLLSDLRVRRVWIEYKNKTVHTKEFYRVEKETLDKILKEKATGTVDPKKILDMMANLGILRKQGDKILSTATVDGYPKRIYMIRIDSVESID